MTDHMAELRDGALIADIDYIEELSKDRTKVFRAYSACSVCASSVGAQDMYCRGCGSRLRDRESSLPLRPGT